MPDRSWTLLDSRYLANYKILRVREDRYRFEPSKAEAEFIVCDTPDWALVIPITVDRQVVFIRQYRHGVQQVVLEIPGGVMNANETAEAAAARELREETGFAAESVRSIGRLLPNPALNNARCHVCVAEGCQQVGEAEPDPLERIEIVLRPLDSVGEMIRSGELRHAQVIAAFTLKEAVPAE